MFVKDREKGETAEKLVRKIFKKAKIETFDNDGDTLKVLRGYDFSFNYKGKEYRVEVKNDLYEAKSGNIAVEYFNPKTCKCSGIYASTSHFYIYVLSDESVWICSTHNLVIYVMTKKPYKDILCGGDGNASMKLYKRDIIFEDLFVEVNNPKKLTAILDKII